ncbi:MAG: helix-turn-helix domain-containing protein [Acidobacteria bacterium]|nr:helix-turn-helix domain-containing protein [Acidobacteriota bacterium]
MSFGATLKTIRQHRAFTQREAAARISMDTSYWSRLENDRFDSLPTADTIADISLALECSREEHDALMIAAGRDRVIDMILYCPNCHEQHIDAPDPAQGWTNPPHKSHQCHNCTDDAGNPFVWRPADVHTNGVRQIKTRGMRDSRPVASRRRPDP